MFLSTIGSLQAANSTGGRSVGVVLTVAEEFG